MNVQVSHSLPAKIVRQRLDYEATKNKDLALRWSSDFRADFALSGVEGVLQIYADRVTVDADLPLLLQAIEEKIEDNVREQLQTILAAPAPAPPPPAPAPPASPPSPLPQQVPAAESPQEPTPPPAKPRRKRPPVKPKPEKKIPPPPEGVVFSEDEAGTIEGQASPTNEVAPMPDEPFGDTDIDPVPEFQPGEQFAEGLEVADIEEAGGAAGGDVYGPAPPTAEELAGSYGDVTPGGGLYGPAPPTPEELAESYGDVTPGGGLYGPGPPSGEELAESYGDVTPGGRLYGPGPPSPREWELAEIDRVLEKSSSGPSGKDIAGIVKDVVGAAAAGAVGITKAVMESRRQTYSPRPYTPASSAVPPPAPVRTAPQAPPPPAPRPPRPPPYRPAQPLPQPPVYLQEDYPQQQPPARPPLRATVGDPAPEPAAAPAYQPQQAPRPSGGGNGAIIALAVGGGVLLLGSLAVAAWAGSK